jgi:hypothetical protein
MSKNLTRKGLALGTAAALTVAGLTATPAFAADAVKISSKFGSSYSVPLYSGFTFNLSGTDLAAAIDNDSLAFAITAPTGTDVYWETANTDATITGDGSAQVIDGDLLDDLDAKELYIELSDPEAAADVKVVAFIDDENIGELDATESQFSRTVKYVVPTVSIALDAPFAGDSALTGSVSLGSVNVAQATAFLGDGATVEMFADLTISENGSLLAGADEAGTDTVVTWNDTDETFDFSVLATVGAGDKFVVQGYTPAYDADAAADAWAKSGTVVKATVVADKVASLDAIEITESVNAVDNGGDATVRSSATSVVLTAQAWEVDQDTKSPAGQPVRVNVTASTFDADSKFTVAGKTFDDAADDITYFGTTNASGEVVISLSGTFADADSLEFVVDAQTQTENYTVAFEDTAATYVVATSVNDDGVITVKNDASFSVSYAAVDQFGQALSGKYRLALTSTGNGQEDFTAPLSGGKATVSFTDSSTADDSYSVSADLEIYDADAKTWGDAGLNAATVNVESLEALLVSSEIDGLADLDGATLEAEDFASVDSRLNPAGAPSVNGGTAELITGTVVDVDGFAVSGAKVTVAAKGLQFSDESGEIFAVDSITVNADSFGEFSVAVWSHTAGDVDITVASGSAKETITYTWDAPTVADDADNIFTVTAAKTSVAGGSFVVITAKLTDKWGNAVDAAAQDVEFEVDGLGYLSSDVVELSSKGVARTTLITSANDKGDAVITATLVGANDVDAAELKIVVGATPAATAAASGSTGKFFASATNAAGKKVVVKVNGVFAKSFTGTAAKKVISVVAAKGTKTITIFVGGKLVKTQVVIVK